MVLPCLAKTGGNCQEAVMLVEELAVNLKAVGGCDGTKINIARCVLYSLTDFYCEVKKGKNTQPS